MIVIFQQEALGVNTLENRPGNEVVATFDQPTAALIASSQMKAKGNPGEVPHNGIVHFDSPL